MNSIKKTIQKTSGIHKKYKPGQLITIDRNVYRVTKYKFDYFICLSCDLKCDYICSTIVQCLKRLDNNCYLKLVKKHKG